MSDFSSSNEFSRLKKQEKKTHHVFFKAEFFSQILLCALQRDFLSLTIISIDKECIDAANYIVVKQALFC